MSEQESRILANRKFISLVRQRNRFMWILFSLTLVVFFAYTLVLAFAPSWLAIPLWPGATTNIGIPLGIGVVVISFIFTGIYTWRANREFDRLTREILQEAGKVPGEQAWQ